MHFIGFEPLLSFKNFSVKGKTANDSFKLLEEINMTLRKGEIFGVIGMSGSGKSSLARSLLGEYNYDKQFKPSGSLLFQNKDLLQLTKREFRQVLGNNIVLIPQHPKASLNPLMRVGDQVKESLSSHIKWRNVSLKEKVLETFSKLNIKNPSEFYSQYPHQLSGGLCQKVAISMAIIVNPDLIIADESMSALDVKAKLEIYEVFKNLKKENSTSMLFISHDLKITEELSDRIMVMNNGEIIEEGESSSVLSNPFHPVTKRMVASMPSNWEHIKGEAQKGLTVLKSRGCSYYHECEYSMCICASKKPTEFSVATNHKAKCWLHHKSADLSLSRFLNDKNRLKVIKE